MRAPARARGRRADLDEHLRDARRERAPFPDLPWLTLPQEHIVITDVKQKTNWVQSIEGSIDSSHTTTLHQDEIGGSDEAQTSTVVSKKGDAIRFARPSSDPHPRIQVRDTDFGFIYGALRKPIKDPDKMVYVRATAFACPGYVTFPLSSVLRNVLIFVPYDETHAHFYSIWYSMTEAMDRKGRIAWSGLDPAKDLDAEGYLKLCALPNWGQDRDAMVGGTLVLRLPRHQCAGHDRAGEHGPDRRPHQGASRAGRSCDRAFPPADAGDGARRRRRRARLRRRHELSRPVWRATGSCRSIRTGRSSMATAR